MDPLLVLGVISSALAVKASDLIQLVRGKLGSPSSEDEKELAAVVDRLRRDELIAERKVGDDSIYAITARGAVTVEREAAKKSSLFRFLL